MSESPNAQPTLAELVADPLYENTSYAVVILADYIPQAGTGLYGVVNKDTLVVEVSNPQYPVAIEACNHLDEKSTEARMARFQPGG